MLAPNFSLEKIDLAILFSAMILFLALIWVSKKLLYFISISDFAISLSIKKDERRAKAIKQRGKIKDSFLKVNLSKEEKARRKKLYQVKQKRYETQELKKKFRTQNGRVTTFDKMLDRQNRKIKLYQELTKLQTPISKRIPKSVNNKKSTGKRTNRRDFMSKKYNETVFSNPLKDKTSRLKVQLPLPLDRTAGWKTRQNKAIEKQIKSRPLYKSSMLIDAGKQTFIVRTKDERWFMYSTNKWSHLSDKQAKHEFDKYYYSSHYEKLK